LTVAKTAVCTGVLLACVVPAAALSSPSPALASDSSLHGVRIVEGLGGRKVIFNETPVERSRRFSADLLPVPDLPGLPAGALEPLIRRHCDAHRLDARLVRAVIQVESGYNHRARSNKGAMGLMQLMPGTATELAVADPYDADQNLRGGTAYLRRLIDAFRGSLEMALAAYNAGPGAVERHRGIPPYPDTRDYVRRVLALYQGGGAILPAVQWRYGSRPAPHVTRGANGRLLVTTSVSGLSGLR
jgi:hypothetical protein